jgi:hypothetical protein
MPKTWFRIALLNFLIAGCIGALLRYAFVDEVSWLKFQNWLHGHSHVAMLGWVYQGLFALIIGTILPIKRQKAGIYKWLFGLTQVSVLGMLISFPIVGYGSLSVTFSTLHILLSYAFAWAVFKDLKTGNSSLQKIPWSHRFVKTALVLMLLSTVAIWSLLPIIASGKAGTALYYGAVQFYLHFQFNGWFIFAVLGLFLKLVEERQISISNRNLRTFYFLLLTSCILTFALAITWSTPLPLLFLINSIGVFIQLGALMVFVQIVGKIWPHIRSSIYGWARVFLILSFVSFVIKILIQTSVIIPAFATVAYTIRNYVIGFLHLMLLGMVSGFIFGFGALKSYIQFKSSPAIIGAVLFLLGFVLSEGVLFLQGTMFWAAMGFLPKYYELLFSASALIPLGVFIILISNIINKPQH